MTRDLAEEEPGLCPVCGGAGEVWSAYREQEVYCRACSGLGIDLTAFADDEEDEL